MYTQLAPHLEAQLLAGWDVYVERPLVTVPPLQLRPS